MKHTTPYDWYCPCGYDDCVVHKTVINYKTATIIDAVVDHFIEVYPAPIYDVYAIVTSANRCLEHNRDVGSTTDKSKHVLCIAVDFGINDVAPKEVADLLEAWFPNSCGIGRYKTFTHFDPRREKARWGRN